MWGDTASIERLAAQCVATADNVDVSGSRARRTAAAVEWHSTAGDAFTSRIDGFRQATAVCVGEFEHAAALLRHHAATVHHRAEEIQRLERAAADLLQRGLHFIGL